MQNNKDDNNRDANNARIMLAHRGFLQAMLLHPIVGTIVYLMFKDAFTFGTSLVAEISYVLAFVSLCLLIHSLFLVRFHQNDKHSNLSSWEIYFSVALGLFGIFYAAIFSVIAFSLGSASFFALSMVICCVISLLGFLMSASKLAVLAFASPVSLAIAIPFIMTQSIQAYLLSAFIIGYTLLVVILSRRNLSLLAEGLVLKEETKYLRSKLSTVEAKLSGLVTTDKATGLFTREFFNKNLAVEFRRAKRSAANLSILIAEIDCFKEYEDDHGTKQTIKTYGAVASVLKSITKRAGEMVALYNNRSFVFLLPGVAKDDAKKFAQVIQKTTLGLRILNKHTKVPGVQVISLSVGIGEFQSDAVLSRDDLLKYAEETLLPAHKNGAIDITKPSHWFTFGNKSPESEIN